MSPPSTIHRVGTLEIDEHLSYQRNAWRMQRVAWIVMGLLFIAACAGLFGSGPVSDAVAGERGSALWVEYERFGRLQAPDEIRVHIKPTPEQLRDGRITLWVSREYADRLKIDSVMPTPDVVRHAEGRIEFDIRMAAPAPAAPAGEVEVTFEVQPQAWGRRRAELGVAGGPAVAWGQFVYP